MLAVVCAGALILPAAAASAHAVFVSAYPAPGARLARPPARIRIVFSEPLTAALSGISLRTPPGTAVAERHPGADPSDHSAYEAGLPRLRPGRYTVVWHTTSAVDGHSRWGSYSFTVLLPGGGQPPGARVRLPLAAPPALPVPVQAAVSWLGLAGLFLVTGAVLMMLLGAVPSAGPGGGPAEGTAAGPAGQARRALAGLLAAGAAACACGVGGQAAASWAGTGWARSALAAVLTQGVAHWWWLRLAAVTAVLLACHRRAHLPAGRRPAAIAAVAALAVSFAGASHGAASASPAAGLAVMAAHVLAGSVWLGGVLALATLWAPAARGRAASCGLRLLARRFSVVAGMAVPVVAATGAASAVLELGRAGDLLTSGYGRALLVKVALAGLAGLAGLAALASMRTHRDSPGRPWRSQRACAGLLAEAGLGMVLLVPAAVMSVLAPPGPAAALAERGGWLLVIAVFGASATVLAGARALRRRQWHVTSIALGGVGCLAATGWAGVLAIAPAAAAPLRPAAWGVARPVTPLTAAGAALWPVGGADPGLMMPALGPGGSVWVGEMNTSKLAVLSPASRVVRQVALPGGIKEVMGLAVGRDGHVWAAEEHAQELGMFDPATGRYRQYRIPGASPAPVGIALDPAGNVWFTEMNGDSIGRFDPVTGRFTQFRLPTPGALPYWLAIAPDGRVWFTEFGAGKVGVLRPATGRIREFPLPGRPNPAGIAIGPGGTPWLATTAGWLVRVSPGTGRLHRIRAPVANLYGVAVTGDGVVWLGTASGRAVYAFSPASGSFQRDPLPAGQGPWWVTAGGRHCVWAALGGTAASGLVQLPGQGRCAGGR